MHPVSIPFSRLSNTRIRRQVTLLSLTCIMVALSFVGCNQRPSEEKVLAEINDYTLTLHEFEKQLSADLEMEPDFKLTEKAKEAYLERLIQKELLIQEAMKRKLDRRDKFVRAIERYWQSTLIRDLIELKSEEISKRVVISEEEIKARYDRIKASKNSIAPFEELREQIRANLKEEKKTEKLEEWMENLKKSAKIQIHREQI